MKIAMYNNDGKLRQVRCPFGIRDLIKATNAIVEWVKTNASTDEMEAIAAPNTEYVEHLCYNISNGLQI